MSSVRLTAIAALLLIAPIAHAAPRGPINAVVGDASWIARFGRPPSAEDERWRDDERHRVHLEWIEQKLRERPVDGLSAERRAMRTRLLDALADYRRRGVHPKNDRSERLPRWMDGDGRVCAVGRLIEVSAGRAFLERINAHWEYDYLAAIHDPELDAWIDRSGFTKQELASIQPIGYAGIGLPDLGDGDAWFAGIGAVALFGVNVALVAVDLSLDRRPGPPDTRLAVTNVVFGVAQLIGAAIAFGFAPQADFDPRFATPVLIGASITAAFATFDIVFGSVALAAPDS